MDQQHISPESIQLIANLINDKNKDLKEHFDVQIRMVKTTVQETHNITTETRDLARKTNGRVNKLDDTVFGEIDKNNNIIKGKEGILFDIDNINSKFDDYIKKYWKVTAGITAFILSVQIPQIKALFIKVIDKIF